VVSSPPRWPTLPAGKTAFLAAALSLWAVGLIDTAFTGRADDMNHARRDPEQVTRLADLVG
jgi:hypothetical protein